MALEQISLEKAGIIWDRLVPKKTWHSDFWDFRVNTMNAYCDEDLILYDGKNFLPLQHDSKKDFYFLLGGMLVSKNYLTFDPAVLSDPAVPKNIYLDYLPKPFSGSIPGVSPRFFIDTKSCPDFETFTTRFDGKRRRMYQRQVRNFPEYSVDYDGTFDELVALNLKYHKESDFRNPLHVGFYKMLLEKYPNYLKLQTIRVDGKIASATFYLAMGESLACMIWGREREFDNVLKIGILEEIKLAKQLGLRYVDYQPTSSFWKYDLQLDAEPVFRFKRGSVPSFVENANEPIPEKLAENLRSRGLAN